MKEKIIVSGVGIVSSLGVGVNSNVDALIRGATGVGPIRYLDTRHTEYPVGEVKLSNEEMKLLLGMDSLSLSTRSSLLGMLAVKEALGSARLICPTSTTESLESDGCGCVAFINGTTVGGMDMTERFFPEIKSGDEFNDYMAIHDCGSCTELIVGYVEEKLNFAIDQIQTISTACSSAANAILLGAMLIRNHLVDLAIVGGCECLTRFHLNGFNALKILDTDVCKPFDSARKGINLGEGAAYLVLETESHYKKREKGFVSADRRMPLCVLSGFANTCDAYHQTASSPDGEGAFLAMREALSEAEIAPEAIDYINAHGTGTINNDESEAMAIRRVFGSNVPPVSSTKSFTGHATSAAGAIEAVISIEALLRNFIPCNLNFSGCIKDFPIHPQQQTCFPSVPLVNVLSNSFGFGGNNTSLIFSRYEL